MADLIAQGTDPANRWRRTLPPGRKLTLGRATGAWSIAWDDRISRRHFEIIWEQGRLEIEELAEATNPVFFRGQKRQTAFYIKPGEHFVVGNTTFTLADERVNVTQDAPRPVNEQTFSHQALDRVRFRNTDQRITVLSRLPEMIKGATDESELFVRLVNVLLTGIARANVAAVVALRGEGAGNSSIEVKHWDRRMLSGEEFSPSEKLIRQSIETHQSVVHVWSRTEADKSAYTLSNDADWAFCTPVRGDACRGWGIYVAGRFASGGAPSVSSSSDMGTDPNDLRDDLKFTELAATTLSNLRSLRLFERNHASLSQFFSPVVLEALEGQDPEVVLAPREAEVSVLFCDLRGFSLKSEKSAGDLIELLKRVSRALGVMTHHILEQGGVVGDFHGDAAMGFWGWPLSQEDATLRACQAALGIRREFESAAREEGNPLADFRMGIGIATGRAVAGKLGTIDQVKVTVFGPVVNLASRLEGMTKYIRAPILLDEPTAKAVRSLATPDVLRVRRVAVVKPYGLEAPVEVSELVPPVAQHPQLTDDHIAAYEKALDALLASDWGTAVQLLHQVPAQDRVKDFITVFIAQHNRTPPDRWDGVIPLAAK
jgi:adenylate cyclase